MIEGSRGKIKNRHLADLLDPQITDEYPPFSVQKRLEFEDRIGSYISAEEVKNNPQRIEKYNKWTNFLMDRLGSGFLGLVQKNIFSAIAGCPPAQAEGGKNTKISSSWKERITLSDVSKFSDIGLFASKAVMNVNEEIHTPEGDVLRLSGNFFGYGKGFSAEAADKSAAMEHLERYFAIARYGQNRKTIIKETKDIIGNDRYISPDIFPSSRLHPLDEDFMEWVEVSDMKTGEQKYIPAGIFYFEVLPHDKCVNPYSGVSSGLAASDNEDYSIAHATKETAERDQDKIVSLYPALYQKIDNNTLPENERRIVRKLKERGIETDIVIGWTDGVPYFINVDLKEQNKVIASGSRHDTNPVESLRGALSEAALAKSVHDEERVNYPENLVRESRSPNKQLVDFNVLRDLSCGNATGRIVDDYSSRGIRFFKGVVYKGPEGVVTRVVAPYAMSSVFS